VAHQAGLPDTLAIPASNYPLVRMNLVPHCLTAWLLDCPCARCGNS